MELNGVEIEDTFAEAFPGVFARFLITAKNEKWAKIAAREATGYGTSMIGCSAEAGIEKMLPPEETPDGRPGAVVQFWTMNKKALKNLKNFHLLIFALSAITKCFLLDIHYLYYLKVLKYLLLSKQKVFEILVALYPLV